MSDIVSIGISDKEYMKHTCHFKQVGLKLGLPAAASAGVLKTYRRGFLLGLAERAGNVFASYVIKGVRSKTYLMGGGKENRVPIDFL